MIGWRLNLPLVNKTHGEMMHGALPPGLIQLKAEADTDLTDYSVCFEPGCAWMLSFWTDGSATSAP